VNSKGLKLGIWFEPECLSPDSDLYRDHPDWVIKVPGRTPAKCRWQWQLDLANPAVCDYIYDSIANVLNTTNIEYIKWDYNRVIAHAGSERFNANEYGEYFHRYTLGLYSVLERLNKDFPHVLFEGCASGGGRFDMGMLYYMPQIWTSDDTDAVERTAIQHGTSYIYPMCCQSAHVSVCPNHQTQRVVTLEARHIIALTGSFGYELAPQRIPEEERGYIKEFIKFYNENYELFQSGKYYRLTNPATDDYAVFEYVLDNKVVLGCMRLKTHAINLQTKFRLKGLDPERIYTDTKTGKQYYGAQLMEMGLPIDGSICKPDYETFMVMFE
jgi:alpha-galactosidase